MCLIVMLLCTIGIATSAQDDAETNEVWVTTQDYANLRLSHGENWEILTRLDYGITLQASGRSYDGRWIQVMYEGDIDHPDATINGVTYGWVAYWLLVWTGDIFELPVDGVKTVRIARPSRARLTARYYFSSAGLLLLQLQRVVERNEVSWQTISQRWYDLEGGFQTTCNEIPPLTIIPAGYFAEVDVQKALEYAPVIVTLERVIDNMNNATAIFAEVCNREENQRFATHEDVRLAITYVENANRERTIVELFLKSLR